MQNWRFPTLVRGPNRRPLLRCVAGASAWAGIVLFPVACADPRIPPTVLQQEAADLQPATHREPDLRKPPPTGPNGPPSGAATYTETGESVPKSIPAAGATHAGDRLAREPVRSAAQVRAATRPVHQFRRQDPEPTPEGGRGEHTPAEGDDAEADVDDEEADDVKTTPESGRDPEAPSLAPGDSPAGTPAEPEAALDEVTRLTADDLPAVLPVTGADAKLDGVLLELLRARRNGGDAALAAYVEQHRPGMSVDRLRVQIVSASVDAAEDVRARITALDGTVTTTFENYVWADLSLAQVEALAATESVWTIDVSQALLTPGR